MDAETTFRERHALTLAVGAAAVFVAVAALRIIPRLAAMLDVLP